MPTALILECGRGDGWGKRPDAVRAAAYALLHLGSPTAAQQIHDRSGPRPFTAVWLPGDAGRLRLTAFEEEVEEALLGGVVALARGAALVIGQQRVPVRRCLTDLPPLAQTRSWAELATTTLAGRWNLELATPTAFAQGDRPDLPLPIPERLVMSWAERWNRFAPEPLRFAPEVLAEAAGGLALARFEGGTAAVRRARCIQIGFVGRASFEAPSRLSDEARHALSTLFGFSSFSGSGIGTTLGLGLTLPTSEK